MKDAGRSPCRGRPARTPNRSVNGHYWRRGVSGRPRHRLSSEACPSCSGYPADGRTAESNSAGLPPYSERFQRCLSRVRTALVMTVMRLGLIGDLRKICQDFSCAMPRSTGALAAARAWLTVRWGWVSSPPGGRLSPVVTQGPAPRSLRELGRLGLHKRSPWSGLAPPTPTSDQAGGVDARRRWTAPIFR